MRVTVDQASLLAVLKRAAVCTSHTSTRLDDRLLRLATAKDAHGNDALAVGATDHLLAYRGLLEGPAAGVTVTAPGLLLFDAKELVTRVERMPEGLITIGIGMTKDAHGERVVERFPSGNLRAALKHAKARRAYHLAAVPEKGLAPIRWPDKSQAKSLADLSGETLARILTRAMWAAEPSEADAALNALVLTIGRDRFRVSAGTNRSMAVAELPAGALVHTYPDGDVWEGLLSLKSAKALVSFGQSVGPATLSLCATPNQLVAELGPTRLGCALLALPARDYAGVIAILGGKAAAQEIVVPKRALLDAVAATRTAVVATSDNPGLYLAAHGSALYLVGEGSGDARDQIPTASPITRSMVGQYLPSEITEATTAAESESVSLLFCDVAGVPILLTDMHEGLSYSAAVIGMTKYRSRWIEDLFAGKVEEES